MVGSRNRIAAAEDQLLRLGEEFDLADAAPSELDIVTGDRDARMPAMAVDLALDGVDVLDGGVVRLLRQMKGSMSFRNSAPAVESPAHWRALIQAARSQFWPMLS